MRVGIAVGGAALVLLGGAVLSWGARSEATSTDVVVGIDSVVLEGGRGDVEVRHVPGSRGEVTATVSRSWFGADPGDEAHRRMGSRLVLDTDCGRGCSVDYVVELPDPVEVSGRLGSGDLRVRGMGAVRAETGSGEIDVRGVAGPVDVRTSSGGIELADVAGDLVAETGSGRIEGEGLRGRSVRAHSGSGEVELVAEAPEAVLVETGSGGIELTVPDGAYRVLTDTGSGSADVAVAERRDAPRSLELSTGSGDIEVRAD